MTPAKRLIVAGAILAGLLGVRYLTSSHVENFDYWTSEDPRFLGVVIIQDRSYSCGVDETIETAVEVQVMASCREPLVLAPGGSGVATGHIFTLTLSEPIGDRAVVDARGNPAGRCADVRCGEP